MTADKWLSILQACVPILVAFVGIIPTVIANRKKTQESLKDMQNKIVEDINNTKTEVTDIQTKLKYSLIVNAVSLVAIAAIVFLLLK